MYLKGFLTNEHGYGSFHYFIDIALTRNFLVMSLGMCFSLYLGRNNGFLLSRCFLFSEKQSIIGPLLESMYRIEQRAGGNYGAANKDCGVLSLLPPSPPR